MQKKYETNRVTRELVTIAVMSALAVASRVAFMAVPHFKPMVGIIMITGMAFGVKAGFITGAMSAFVSNFFFGQGPWTLFQMAGYGVAGVIAALVRKMELIDCENRLFSAVFGFATVVFVVGPILDTSTLVMVMNVVNMETVAAVYLAGLPVNAKHGIATAITLLVLGKPMIRKLERMKIKYGIFCKK